MITDKLTTFGMPVSLDTSGTGTEQIGEVIDTGVTDHDLGVGYPFYFYISVADAATSGGAATAQFELVTAEDEAITTGVEVLATSKEFALADMGEGEFLVATTIPYGQYKRWLALRQVTETAAFTGGSVNAFLTQEPDRWRAYPEGLN